MKRAFLSVLVLATLVAIVLVVRRTREEPPEEPHEEALSEETIETSPPAEEPPAPELPPLDGPGEATPAVSREEIDTPPSGSGTAVALPPPNSAPVRGRLTDASTGEPLGFYAIEIRDSSGRPREVVTGEDGRYATSAPMASGRLEFRFLDARESGRTLGESALERAVVDGAAPDVDLTVASGPTFRFAITPADVDPTRLLARLRIANLDAQGKLDTEFLRAGHGTGPRGSAPWVRFPQVPEKFDRAESLEVESEDGLWSGSAKVSAIRGDAGEIVPLALEARGVLLGKVVDPSGQPIQGARVRLDGTTTAGKSLAAGSTTGPDGSYRFPLLAEGTGTISVRSLRHVPRESPVHVVAGSLGTLDFILEPLPPAGAIAGRIESRTGTFDPRVEITLVPLETPAWEPAADKNAQRPRLSALVSWTTVDGKRVGTFGFGNFPTGRYELRVRDKGYLAWDPDRAVVSPPSTETVFLVQDDQPNADFVFRVRDADDGTELQGAQVAFQLRGQGAPWTKLAPGTPALARYPVDRPFRWRLDLEGYRTATGDERAFSIEDESDGRARRIAEVDLLRGWGEVFRVVSNSRGRPLAGASVVLDGREAGTSGSDGLVVVSAPEKPARVEVRYKDWVLVEPLDLRAVWMRRLKGYVTASLAPPAKPRGG